jgi:hypothetical protein
MELGQQMQSLSFLERVLENQKINEVSRSWGDQEMYSMTRYRKPVWTVKTSELLIVSDVDHQIIETHQRVN